MTAKEIKENAKKYVLQSWSKQGALDPIPVEKAEGIYFYDYDGNRYTDMSSQLVNMNLGYEIRILRKQSGNRWISTVLSDPPMVRNPE